MTDPTIVEAAARAIGQANEDNNWEGVPEDYREWYRELAMCALVKVTPLIRAQVLEEAAQVADDHANSFAPMSLVAKRIRALKEQP